MAIVDMCIVSMPGTLYRRTIRTISPSLFFLMSGRKISDGSTETWISRGVPDRKATTHLGAAILKEWTTM